MDKESKIEIPTEVQEMMTQFIVHNVVNAIRHHAVPELELVVRKAMEIAYEQGKKDAYKFTKVEDGTPDDDRRVLCARTETSMGGTKLTTPALGTCRNDRFSCEMDWVSVVAWAEIPKYEPEKETK